MANNINFGSAPGSEEYVDNGVNFPMGTYYIGQGSVNLSGTNNYQITIIKDTRPLIIFARVRLSNISGTAYWNAGLTCSVQGNYYFCLPLSEVFASADGSNSYYNYTVADSNGDAPSISCYYNSNRFITGFSGSPGTSGTVSLKLYGLGSF